MSNIFLTSDTHFFHDKPFIYASRGFECVEEMNETIIERWNAIVGEDDIVYHLGDVFMGADKEAALKMVQRLNGKIYLAYGNHDTDARLKEMANLSNIVDIQMGYRLKAGKKCVILTHYPTLTANVPPDRVWSFHGHTHQQESFVERLPLCYHVGVDSHNCTPIAWEDAIKEMRERQNEIIQRNQKG